METEQYSLTWKNHIQHVRDSFSNLLQRNTFCDVTLYAEGQRIGAHKVFLTACSGYFNQLFAELHEEERPIIVLKGIQFDILKQILSFVYNGQVSIEMEKIKDFLEAAQFLEVYGLVNDKVIRKRTHSKLEEHSMTSEADTEYQDSPRPPESEVIETEAGSNDSLVGRLLEYEGYGFFQNNKQNNDKPEKEHCNFEAVKRSNDWTSDYESLNQVVNPKRKKIKSEMESINEQDFANSLDAEIDNDDDSDDGSLETEMLNTPLTTITENGFQCNICNKIYLLKDSLKKHFAVHTKNTTCMICGLTLSRKSHLKRHMKKHMKTTAQEVV